MTVKGVSRNGIGKRKQGPRKETSLREMARKIAVLALPYGMAVFGLMLLFSLNPLPSYSPPSRSHLVRSTALQEATTTTI
jgi:hypothetical protein